MRPAFMSVIASSKSPCATVGAVGSSARAIPLSAKTRTSVSRIERIFYLRDVESVGGPEEGSAAADEVDDGGFGGRAFSSGRRCEDVVLATTDGRTILRSVVLVA